MLSSTLSFPAILVHTASICYVVALMIREQLILRAFILLGTAFYIAYYYFAADIPLWEAIFWSMLMGGVNIYVMIDMMLERTTFSMSDENKELFKAFKPMTPGQFRKFLKISDTITAEAETLLTVEGAKSDYLYYVIAGPCRALRKGRSFSINESCFIGEISMLLETSASATTLVVKGGRYLRWKRADIEKLQYKNPAIAVALSNMMKIDLAGKVAKSVRTDC